MMDPSVGGQSGERRTPTGRTLRTTTAKILWIGCSEDLYTVVLLMNIISERTLKIVINVCHKQNEVHKLLPKT